MSNRNIFEITDFHIHTLLSPCAKNEMSIDNIILTAKERNLEYIGITDHVTATVSDKVIFENKRILENITTDIKVFLGCEADILSVGRHCITQNILDIVDYVCVSANHFHTNTVAQPSDLSLGSLAKHYLEMFKYACSLDFVDVIVHPMTVFPGTFDSSCLELIKDNELIELLEMAKENKIAIEISPRALYKDQFFFKIRFYELCKKIGVKFSIGSDAHRIETIAPYNILYELIKELEISEKDIWLPMNN